jgi:hypothetical protein
MSSTPKATPVGTRKQAITVHENHAVQMGLEWKASLRPDIFRQTQTSSRSGGTIETPSVIKVTREWSEARQERRYAMRGHQTTYESSMPTRNCFEATRPRRVTLRKTAEPACGRGPRFIAGRRSGSPDPRSRPGGCLAAVRTLARFEADARRRCDDKFRSRRGAGRRSIPQPCQCTRHRCCMSLDG